MTQKFPSKFFPTALGISGRVTRRTTQLGMVSIFGITRIAGMLMLLSSIRYSSTSDMEQPEGEQQTASAPPTTKPFETLDNDPDDIFLPLEAEKEHTL